MRYRLMATYQGQPYEAGIGPSEGDVVLFAACPPPEELGFEPATGHWRKPLRDRDVEALWESRPTGTFRGEPCIILDDLGDRLHIAFLGHDAYLAERLGYWQVDRGVFELITPRDEVIEIVEERSDYPPRSAAARQQIPGPGAHDLGFGPAAAGTGQAGPAATVPVPSLAASRIAPATPDQAFGPAIGDPGPALTPQAATPPGLSAPAGVAVPPYEEAPLPLEAAALRATSAAARQQPLAQQPPAQQPLAPDPAAQQPLAQQPLAQQSLAPDAAAQLPLAQQLLAHEPAAQQHAAGEPAAQELAEPSSRRRRAAPRRVATQRIFSELADLAAIPATAYAVGAEVDGAMCLLQTEHGYEVFNAIAGARHEVRLFDDEESAYFYLFGVLAAEAVRTGGLVPHS
jgi:hypothetical protein